MKLSIVMPCYNEIATNDTIIERVLRVSLPIDCELIMVDDCSTDGTRDCLTRWRGREDVKIVLHEVNRGKGAALCTGFACARGDNIIVQDADLEYAPDDYPKLVQPILDGRADVVYGSRFSGGNCHHALFF